MRPGVTNTIDSLDQGKVNRPTVISCFSGDMSCAAAPEPPTPGRAALSVAARLPNVFDLAELADQVLDILQLRPDGRRALELRLPLL